MSVSYIWFDLGYTLVYQEREAIYLRFLRESGIEIPPERIEQAYHLTDKLFMREYPGALGRDMNTFYPWYLGALNYSLGLHFDLDRQNNRLREFHQEQKALWRAFPFTASILKSLKNSGYGIGLISNWDHTARAVLQDTGLLPLFDHLIISSEVDLIKPDEAIFVKALQQAGVSAKESLYVGDNYYDDVVGSGRVGMNSYLINRFGTLGIEEIAATSIIPSIQELPQLLSASSKIIS